MAGGCCGGSQENAEKLNDAAWRRVLWIALVINAVMFGVEIVAGVTAGSASLKADALDFMGDAANYAISLGVAGMALAWRARAALAKACRSCCLASGCWATPSGWRYRASFLPPRPWVSWA